MIEFATWNTRHELSALWCECFGDPKRIPDFFLNNIFSPKDCLVYRVGNELAAAVYLLPARICRAGEAAQAHYVFAAATARRYRGRGYMSSLLAGAALVGSRRGDCYSAVLPADDGLYRFYEAAGYRDFFKVHYRETDESELRAAAEKAGTPSRLLPDWAALNRLRSAALSKHSGSLLWDDKMFCLSASMNKVYGDRLVCASAGGEHAYALCRTNHGVCDVLEAFAGPGAFPALFGVILREAPAGRYRFRLPVESGKLPESGQTVRFGMLKPLGGASLEDLQPKDPYLGLAMD
jgi:GNAT superfamily N-acetyltransferase